MSKRKLGKSAASPAAPAPPAVETDPIDVLVAHWSELSGLTREKIREKLLMIGHMAMKENRGGILALKHELEQIIAAKENPQ